MAAAKTPADVAKARLAEALKRNIYRRKEAARKGAASTSKRPESGKT
jgi:hypothetical protein